MLIYILVGLYILCSAFLLAYGVQCYLLTFLYLRKRKGKLAQQRLVMHHYDTITNPDLYPKVVTQLPMYNEKSVAVRIINAVAAIDYPRECHEIQVLDDSTDETTGIIDSCVAAVAATGVNIRVIRRDNRTGYKAGALQNGMEQTDAEFVAIFDADFEPRPDFLKKAVPFFLRNKKLGLVQGRWTHLNRNSSLVTRGQAMGIDGHFVIEQAARSWNNLYMNFNGTAGMFRKEAIESAGGWHHDTLTEDMDLSYRMQIKDWQTEYVPDIEVPAEIPEDINAFKSQQFRWAKGSIQTAKKIIPLLIKKRVSPFKFLQAILHLTHYMVHPVMLLMVLLTMPMLLFVKVTINPIVYAMVLIAVGLATSGPSIMYLMAQHFIGRLNIRRFMMIPAMMFLGTGLAVSNAKAVFEALRGKTSAFHRTPKRGESKKMAYRPLKDLTPIVELVLALYSLIAIYMFFGDENEFVSPFLLIYAGGFLFVGMLSIIHHKKPDLIYRKLSELKAGVSSVTPSL